VCPVSLVARRPFLGSFGILLAGASETVGKPKVIFPDPAMKRGGVVN
jgi:hypothetical protein